MMTALVITLLPSLLLSGFLFPISSMPLVLRAISHIVPAKYFLVIIRGIIMKGIGISYFWEQILFLFGLGTILLILSRSGFKTKLE
jgi:ABC-2 type transport system permease protein